MHRGLKKTLAFSKKVAIRKRIAVMLSTKDVPGLRRVFARAMQRGASIHVLLDNHTRAVSGDNKARGYENRSIQLATVVMRLGGPALLKVLYTAGSLPGVSMVQSRLQNSKVSHVTPGARVLERYTEGFTGNKKR